MSTTRIGSAVAARRLRTAPSKARAASSAPLSTSGQTKSRSWTPCANTSPLAASRVADVAQQRTRSGGTPWAATSAAYSSTAAKARAKRWDGYVPIADPFLSPADLAAYVGEHPRDGWDLVAQWAPGVPAEEFAAVGVTWLMRSVWPQEQGWLDELRALAGSGPRA